nr:cysteine-rich receptor-like protein kinase 44 [Lolium perenne]XP_051205714.1 cysteine-rich receptor-like protein kinase 44 [Lolium perenne]XP_051205715.1 cysteine-rich receptor-like protein kinase 44 [Lolium perenne]
MDTAHVTPKPMSLHLLQELTNGFSRDRKLGGGTYGDVYLGEHKNGEKIAVKVLKEGLDLDDEAFKKEYHNLANLHHKNVVRLVGYCHETKEEILRYNGRVVVADTIKRMLCFDYMHNGSLDSFIYDEFNDRNWCTRYAIIKGICEGLEYLHEKLKPPMYHLDLKPANILLDENMSAKIADFGVSRLFLEEKTRKTNSALGTLGYIPPEYINEGLISIKFDIFSLGVVIIKIMTGREGYFRIAEMSSQQFIELVHMDWMNRLQPISVHVYSGQVRRCIEIALNCVEAGRHKRPSIGLIVSAFNKTESCVQILDALRNDSASSINQATETHGGKSRSTAGELGRRCPAAAYRQRVRRLLPAMDSSGFEAAHMIVRDCEGTCGVCVRDWMQD